MHSVSGSISKPESSEKESLSPTEGPNKEKDRLLRLSEISIWVDTYDDIFSDFDSRPYAHRALSDDFLHEVKKISRENRRGSLELKILIPAGRQNPREESIVRGRLHHYFQDQAKSMETKLSRLKKRGLFLAVFGIISMIVAAYFHRLQSDTFWMSAIIVLLEPVGWFSVWNGADIFISQLGELKPDLIFFRKMSTASIKFMSY